MRTPRRPSHEALTSWISSHVPSLEWPSTKITSVSTPQSGRRRSASSMFTCSLRAGITTVRADGRRKNRNGDERQPAESRDGGHHDVHERADAEEMPRQVRDGTKTNELESRQPCQLRQIDSRNERGDRWPLPQPQAVCNPV